MPLGAKVGLGPGHIVLYGDPAPPKGHTPNFGPCLLWPNGRPSQLLLSTCFWNGKTSRTTKSMHNADVKIVYFNRNIVSEIAHI